MMKKALARLELPLIQALFLAVAMLLMHVLVLMFFSQQQEPHIYHWVVSGAFLLMYAFFNAAYILRKESLGNYIRDSLYGYILLIIFAYGTGLAFSAEGTEGSMLWIFFIVTFAYFFFLTMTSFIRRIMEYAQRQDSESKY